MLSSDVASAEDAAACGVGRVNGVMHAAGVLRDALLLKQTASSFREVLSGKVSGSSGGMTRNSRVVCE
jgi:hypothetical protein